MKWIELNNGNFVNLEQIAFIDIKVCEVRYFCNSNFIISEWFETIEMAKERIEKIRLKILGNMIS